jgi:hypothetical protein
VDESGQTFLPDSALSNNQDCRVDDGDARRNSDEFFHRRAVHTKPDLAIGNRPFGIRVLHRPLNDTDRHLTGSELVFGR